MIFEFTFTDYVALILLGPVYPRGAYSRLRQSEVWKDAILQQKNHPYAIHISVHSWH